MRERVGAGLIVLLAVAAPLGRGGADSTVLALLQTIVLLAAYLAARVRIEPGARMPACLLLAGLFVAWSWGTLPLAGYRFAGLIACWELTIGWLALFAARRLGGSGRVLSGALILSGLAQAGIAAGQYVLGAGLRPAGTFLNPNHLAAYLNLCAALALGRLAARRGRDPLAGAALAGILTAQLLAVASRGALAALALVLLAALWHFRSRLRAALSGGPSARRLAWAALVLTGVMAVAGGFGIARRFAGPEDVYRHHRLRIWPACVGAVADAPWTGTGRGVFEHVADRYNFPAGNGPVRFGRRFSSAHSQYLEVLVETGVPGLLLFLAALGSGFAAAARGGAEGDDGLRLGALLGLSALALQGIGEPLLATPGVALPALVVAGTVLAPPGRRVPRRRAGISIRLAAWGVLAGVYYLAVIAPWLGDRHYGRMLRAADGDTFRTELSRALRSNPLQPYYYSRAVETILDAVPRLEPASYRTCYDYAAKAVRLNPLDRRLLLLRAEVDRRAFQEVFRDAATLEETLVAYDAAVAAAPTDPMPAAAMAGFLLDVGRDKAALETADVALSIEPNFVRARRIRVEALRRLGRDGDAAAAEADLRALQETLRGYVPRNGYEASILGEGDGRADRP